MSQQKRRTGAPAPFPLLLLPHGVIVESVLPCLRPQERGSLACCNVALRSLVQGSVKRLLLPGNSCCMVAGNPLADKMPALAALKITPANLHEAMYTIPTFLLQVGRCLKGLTSLTWHDGLPDAFEGRVKCPTCTAWTNTYDLAALLVTAATCLPHLRHLDFVTHYVSDAECGAIALMTGLTSLRLGGHHGWRRGGLASLSTLTALRALTLLDNGRSANSGDAAALAGLPHLTQLRVGFCPGLVAALLPALADAAPHRASPPQQPQQQQPQQQWAGPAGPSSPSALNPAAQPGRPDAAASSSCSSGGSTSRPVLRSLELSVSHPDVWWSEPELRSIAAGWHLPTVWRLSGLTRLVIGGLLEEVPGGWQGPGLPLACQRGVSALVGLVELVLDWAVPEELLPSLEALSALTLLEVGALPAPRTPLATRLPSLRALVAGLAPPHATCPAQPPSPWLAAAHLALHADPAQQAAWTHVLAATPHLTRLQLSGVVHGAALPRIAAACPHLAQLLLPARSVALGPAQLRSLSGLAALTQLRLGWRSGSTQGPAAPHPLVGVPTLAGLLAPEVAAAVGGAAGVGPQQEAAARTTTAPPQQQQAAAQADVEDDLVPTSSGSNTKGQGGAPATGLTPPWPFAGSALQQELPRVPPCGDSSGGGSATARPVHVPRRAQQPSPAAQAAVAALQQLAARAAHHAAAGGLPRTTQGPCASSSEAAGAHPGHTRSSSLHQGTSSSTGTCVDLPAAALAALQQVAAAPLEPRAPQYVHRAAALSAALRLRLAAWGWALPEEAALQALVQQVLGVVQQQLQAFASRSCEQQQQEEEDTAAAGVRPPAAAAAAAAAAGGGGGGGVGGGGQPGGAPAPGGALAAASAAAAAKDWRWRALQVATAGQQLLLALLLLPVLPGKVSPKEAAAAASLMQEAGEDPVAGGLLASHAAQWLAGQLAAGLPTALAAAAAARGQPPASSRNLRVMASSNVRQPATQEEQWQAGGGPGGAPPDGALVALVLPLAAAAVEALGGGGGSHASSSTASSTNNTSSVAMAPLGSSLAVHAGSSRSLLTPIEPQQQQQQQGPPVRPFQSLRCLELVGPVPARELLLVGLLPPALHQLALTDNASWASGRPPAELLALAEAAGEEVGLSSSRGGSSSRLCALRHLVVSQCPGLTRDLEQQLWDASGGRLEALVSPAVTLGDWARVSHGWTPPEVNWEGWGGVPLGGYTDMDTLPRSPAAVPAAAPGEEGRDVPRWLLQAALDVAAMPRPSQLWRGASQAAQLAASQWEELAAAAGGAGPGAACLLAEALVAVPCGAAALGPTTAACLDALSELVAATAGLAAVCPPCARARRAQVVACLEQALVLLVGVGEVPGEPWSLQLLGAAALQPSNWLLHHASSLLAEVVPGGGGLGACSGEGQGPGGAPEDLDALGQGPPQSPSEPGHPAQDHHHQQPGKQEEEQQVAGAHLPDSQEVLWREALRCWRAALGRYQDLVGGLWAHPAFNLICPHWGAPPGVAGYPAMPSEPPWGGGGLGLIGPVPAAMAEGPGGGGMAPGGGAGGGGLAGGPWQPLVQQAAWAAAVGLLPELQFMGGQGHWLAPLPQLQWGAAALGDQGQDEEEGEELQQDDVPELEEDVGDVMEELDAFDG